jgi:saposin
MEQKKSNQVSNSGSLNYNHFAHLVEAEKPSVSSPQCSLCKLVVSYLDLIIQNNKSEAAIEAALEKICTIVPKDKKQECIQFVDKYGTDLVELLEKFSTPDLVCLALGLCLKETQEIPPSMD